MQAAGPPAGCGRTGAANFEDEPGLPTGRLDIPRASSLANKKLQGIRVIRGADPEVVTDWSILGGQSRRPKVRGEGDRTVREHEQRGRRVRPSAEAWGANVTIRPTLTVHCEPPWS